MSNEFSGPLPASIMEKLPFKQRFMARWYDAQPAIEYALPRSFRQAASYRAWQEYHERMRQTVLAEPSDPKEGQRWEDSTTGEIKEYKGGKWRVVRKA